MNDEQLISQAMNLLIREFGVADATRFLTLMAEARGDVTKDRDALLKEWDEQGGPLAQGPHVTKRSA